MLCQLYRLCSFRSRTVSSGGFGREWFYLNLRQKSQHFLGQVEPNRSRNHLPGFTLSKCMSQYSTLDILWGRQNTRIISVFVDKFGPEPKVTHFIGFTDSAGSVLLFEISHSEPRTIYSNGRLQIFRRIALVKANNCQKYVKYGEWWGALSFSNNWNDTLKLQQL